MMKPKLTLVALLIALSCDVLGARSQDATPAKAAENESSVASAAKKFLATLNEAERGKVQFDFNDDAQRKRWSNLPSGAFERAGLRMGELTEAQRDADKAVVAAALSKQGYEKAMQ